MSKVIDIRIVEKRKAVAESVIEKDYSKYGFHKDFGKLKAEDSEVILILLTVAKLIDCPTVQWQINDAIKGNYLKDWVLSDVLTSCDETFYPKNIRLKTCKNVTRISEKDLVKSFTKIYNTINY